MNKLKILTLLCIAASLSPVLGFGKKTESGKKYPSFYSTGIKVDGNPAEWPSKILFCNFDAKVYYGAANDSNHLYFCVEILNSAEQMKIMRNGLEIWINPEGKKKKTSLVNVTFGSGNKPGEPGDNRMRPPTGGPGSNQMKPPQGDSLPPSILKGNPPKKQGKMMPRQRAFSFPGNITTEGFRDGFNSTWIPGKGKDDFSAFFAYDSTGALILEVRVPVNAFQIDPRNSDCVAMGFEITSMGGGMGQGGFGGPQGGGMQGPGGRQGGGHVEGGIQGGPGGSGMGGGDRMGGGSGMGEPGGGHSGGGFQEESKTYKIWHKFIFAPIP